MKSLIMTLGIIILLSYLNSLKTMLWDSKKRENHLKTGSDNIKDAQNLINPLIPYIFTIFYSLMIVGFLSYSISFLFPSKLIVISILMIAVTIYEFYTTIQHVKNSTYPKLKKFDIPVIMVKSAYIIFFLSLYIIR